MKNMIEMWDFRAQKIICMLQSNIAPNPNELVEIKSSSTGKTQSYRVMSRRYTNGVVNGEPSLVTIIELVMI